MQIPDSILGALEQKHRDATLSILERQLAPCFSGVPDGTIYSDTNSRVGGTVMLPRETGHPCDRSGKPMLLVAQINFGELPESEIDCAKQGLLMLFCNAARDFSNPKDRNAFRCIWIPDADSSAFANSAFADASIGAAQALRFVPSFSLPEDPLGEDNEQSKIIQQVSNTLQSDRQIQLFGKGGKQFEILQEIAAFAGNGISWSEARRSDSCFAHLVEASHDWKLLLKINSLANLPLDQRTLYLLIREEDLKEKNYSKSWLIVR